jgi:hypothetical protein
MGRPQSLPAAQKRAVIGLSLGFFAAIAVFAGRRLLRAADRREQNIPPDDLA